MKTAEKERITIHNSLIMVTNAAFSECTSWEMKQTKILNAEREREEKRGRKREKKHIEQEKAAKMQIATANMKMAKQQKASEPL